ncbi:GntR family transcriptional regulator [Paenibacillus sp. GCM10023252]|uniref:GntR family transcriptional regulator n=1 Tax=Paenibacillus sp. GCM10023252 TaxID=3252649 RepID=UPI003611C05F
MEFQKLDNSNLWDRTYNLLKESIITRRFSPTQKISLPELASQLGVSRTPIRDALNRLEMEGLVRTVPKVGTFVTPLDEASALDIMGTREMLECWSVYGFLQLSSTDRMEAIDSLKQLLKQSAEALDTDLLPDYLSHNYNFRFHLSLVELGGNRRNVEIYSQLMNYRHILYQTLSVDFEMIRAAQQEHEAIVEALAGGLQSDITEQIQEHLRHSKQLLLLRIRDSGGII